MSWITELEEFSNGFVRRGGKKNRKTQVSYLKIFMTFTDSQEKFKSVHRLGNRHVINFWKSHRDLSEKMAYEYWLALCHLWEWLGKTEKPPVPRNFKLEAPTKSEETELNNRSY